LNPTEVFRSGPLLPRITMSCTAESLFSILKDGHPLFNPYGMTSSGFASSFFLSTANLDRSFFDLRVRGILRDPSLSARADSVATYEFKILMPGGAQFVQNMREVLSSMKLAPKDIPVSFWNDVYEARKNIQAVTPVSAPATKPPPP